MIHHPFRPLAAMLACALMASALPARADSNPPPPPLPIPTYADLADLADSAPLVVRAQLRRLTRLEPERARGVAPGKGRFYVEAKTEALLAGNTVLGERLRFLVDLPLDPEGKPPKLKKVSTVLFARLVPGRPEELQLVSPDALVVWDAASDARLRAILAELLGGNPPPRVSGVREAIHVPGNLAGEGETQVFLATPGGEPAAITVQRRPGQRPTWSVSFSELLNANSRPPARETLAWYRLACFLPAALPASAHVSTSADERTRATEDYAGVIGELGACPRTRR